MLIFLGFYVTASRLALNTSGKENWESAVTERIVISTTRFYLPSK